MGLISLECKRVMFTETIHTVWSVNDGTARDLLENPIWQVSGKIEKSMVYHFSTSIFTGKTIDFGIFFLFGCYFNKYFHWKYHWFWSFFFVWLLHHWWTTWYFSSNCENSVTNLRSSLSVVCLSIFCLQNINTKLLLLYKNIFDLVKLSR